MQLPQNARPTGPSPLYGSDPVRKADGKEPLTSKAAESASPKPAVSDRNGDQKLDHAEFRQSEAYQSSDSLQKAVLDRLFQKVAGANGLVDAQSEFDSLLTGVAAQQGVNDAIATIDGAKIHKPDESSPQRFEAAQKGSERSLLNAREALANVPAGHPDRLRLEDQVTSLEMDYRAAYGEPPKASPESKPTAAPNQGEGFAYGGTPIANLDQALQWTPGEKTLSGTDANRQINETYHELSDAFSHYLGEPAVPNWMTFGQFASREAGTQIDALEDSLTALHTATHSTNPKEIYDAVEEAMQHLSPEMAEQVLKLAKSQLEEPSTGEKVLLALSPLLGAAKQAYELLESTLGAVAQLHNALVKGNVGIHNNMAPAYDMFMKAEAEGKDGLQVLQENGYRVGGEKDPQGFLFQAFTRYQEARELGKRAQTASEPEKSLLLDERKKLVHEANLYIGIQEQMVILQSPSIYGDPKIANVVNGQGALSLTDPNGKHGLVGNWADFATRMGLEAVAPGTPGSVAISDHSGKETWYRVPDPAIPGTISAYFAEGLNPQQAQGLLNGAPRPL